MPVKSGFIEGCEEGAVAGGRVDRSRPSSKRISVTEDGAVGDAEGMGSETGFAGAPRSWGVYSVVSCEGKTSEVSVQGYGPTESMYVYSVGVQDGVDVAAPRCSVVYASINTRLGCGKRRVYAHRKSSEREVGSMMISMSC